MTLIDVLRLRQPLPFVDYMHQALYAPGLGYYNSDLPKLGKDGDFVTAPELTPLFGYTLANQCRQIIQALDSPSILEFGAGSGRLCIDILTRLKQLDSLPQNYFILETSADLCQRQQQLIADKIPEIASRVKWLTQWPKGSFNGVVLANEVLDAMPVHRFMKTSDGLLESYILVEDDHSLKETFQICDNERLEAHVNKILPQALTPYLSEANLFIEGWLKECFAMLTQGAVILVDYGFPRKEYYHPDRHLGTIMCHYKHQAHPDFLLHPGLQDITAHVDFTHVAEAGSEAGFHVAGFTNQASFLLANGLLNLLADVSEERARMKANQAIKQLLQPGEMGELFKVMALTKQLDLPLDGFQFVDKRVSL